MPENFANHFQTTLSAAVGSGDLSGTLTSVVGIPAVPFRGIISAKGDNPDEIVLVTARAGSVLTWSRAVEAVAGNQAASAHGVGSTFTAIVTAVGLRYGESELLVDFAAIANRAVEGIQPTVGATLHTSGAVAPTVVSGKAFSTGSGYIYATNPSVPSFIWADVVFGGTGTDSSVTLALTNDDAALTLLNMVHVTFSPTLATVSIFANGISAFIGDDALTYLRPALLDGTIYRVGIGRIRDTLLVVGPNGETSSINDPRVGQLANGKVSMYQATTGNATTAKIVRLGAATDVDWLFADAASGRFAAGDGSVVGRPGQNDQVVVGKNASGMPGIIFGPGVMPCRLVASVAIGATSISVDRNVYPDSTLLLGSGTSAETVAMAGYPAGSGPYVLTVPALTKAHAAGDSVQATPPGYARKTMYMNTYNGTLNVEANVVAVTGDLSLPGLYYNGRVILGTNYLWADAAGRLRIKSSAPASDTDGAVFTTGGVYDVRAYGAKGDGATDDRTAVQAAVTAAQAAGGGTIYFPAGRYKFIGVTLATFPDTTTVNYHVLVTGPNLVFRGEGATSIIETAANTIGFMVFANGVTGANWDFPTTRATVYAMTAAAARANSVTLATPAQAANFAAGDYVIVRTGQTIVGLTDQPDAEVNRVVSVNAGTGVIELSWPLTKAYAQEYFISGTTGKTSTAVTANLAPFGVAKITPYIITGLTFERLHFISTGTWYVLWGHGVVGFNIRNCTGEMDSGITSFNAVRFLSVTDNRFHHTGTGVWTYGVGFGTTTTDVEITGNVFTGEHTPFVHIHEGMATVTVADNLFSSRATATSGAEQHISIRGRAYNVSVTGNIMNSAVETGIFVDPDCAGGGLIDGNIIRVNGVGISTQSANWTVRNNSGSPLFAEGTTLTPQARESLSGWVKWNSQTVTLGTIPAQSIILAVYIAEWTPFNSSGTDLISVGTAADHNAYATGVTVSTGYRVDTPALLAFGWIYSDTVVTAYYTAGGTAPTAGTCCVMIEYVRTSVGSN